MPVLESLRAAVEGCTPEQLLRLLITDRFPGRTVITASLRAPSIVVLKMVADIDPVTPVVFYSQLMAVAFGMDAEEDAALHRNTIRSEKLEKMAKK